MITVDYKGLHGRVSFVRDKGGITMGCAMGTVVFVTRPDKPSPIPSFAPIHPALSVPVVKMGKIDKF